MNEEIAIHEPAGRYCAGDPSTQCVACATPGHWCAARGHAITFADLLAVAPFDTEDRPPAGTECAQCRSFGHYCPAKGLCGSYALCLACGHGYACEQLAAVERIRTGAEMFAPEEGWHSEGRTVELTEADRVVIETPVASDWAMKATLDPENLKRGLKSSARAPLLAKPNSRLEREARSLERRMRKASKAAERVAKAKVKDEEIAMTVKTKRAAVQPLTQVSFKVVDIEEVPQSRGGRGKISPFQDVFDKMFGTFAEGRALMVSLESGEVAKIVEKSARARAKREGVKVRTTIEGSNLWLQHVLEAQ